MAAPGALEQGRPAYRKQAWAEAFAQLMVADRERRLIGHCG